MAPHHDPATRRAIRLFLRAARLGQKNKVIQLLRLHRRMIVNQPSDIDHNTALHFAAQNGHDEVVQILILLRAYINVRNSQGITPIWIAACNGHLSVVKYLCESGALLNVTSESGHTAASIAVERGHEDIFIFLENYGVCLESALCGQSKALHRAAAKNSKKIVHYLIEDIGVPVNFAISNNHQPLHYAARGGHFEMVKYLVEKGADVDAVMTDGGTALFEAAKGGYMKIVDYLVKNNADLNLHSVHFKNCGTPLIAAVSFQHADIVQYLLENNASKDWYCYDGNTSLHIAAMKGFLSVVKVLLEHNVNSGKLNNMGDSPLSLAQRYNRRTVVDYLTNRESAQ